MYVWIQSTIASPKVPPARDEATAKPS
jgi:hypothetical protein